MNQARLAVRVNPQNPDHHLWNNHGIWWCHFTLHSPQFAKQRLRRSLGTRCVRSGGARYPRFPLGNVLFLGRHSRFPTPSGKFLRELRRTMAEGGSAQDGWATWILASALRRRSELWQRPSGKRFPLGRHEGRGKFKGGGERAVPTHRKTPLQGGAFSGASSKRETAQFQ